MDAPTMRPSATTFLGLVICSLASSGASAQGPLTLEQAIAEALAANARLPLTRLDAQIAEQRAAEARAGLGPQVSLEGDFIYAPKGAYALDIAVGEDRAQVVARQPLYEGGALRAEVRGSMERARATRARVRTDEKDVERDVRVQYAQMRAALETVTIHRDTVAQLAEYRTLVKARSASGEGSAADLLRAEARLANEQADLAATERRLDEAKVELNDLLGRAPDADLEIAPLPPSPAPASLAGAAREGPDVAAARAELSAFGADVEAARAGRRPHLELAVDAGFLGVGFANVPVQPGWLGAQLGASLTLNVSWALFDFGLYQARVAQSELLRERAQAALNLVDRQVRLSLARARADEARLARELDARSQAVPIARDALLQTQSLYQGGLATSLEVLDAFSTWRDARLALVDATSAYWAAEAERLRWGTP